MAQIIVIKLVKKQNSKCNFWRKKFLLLVRFRIQSKEKQEIHFTNVNTSNDKA